MNPIWEKKLPHLLILVFAFILYGNTLTYDYTLDDLIVIKENNFTKKGVAGISEIFSYDSFTGFFGVEKKLVAGGRYRPFSIATFAVEYSLMGGLNPFFSHFVNILLYALTGMIIFILFSALLKAPPGKNWALALPFVATMIFMAHPVHTEVVANIKGRDEIFALLFPLLSAWLVLRYLDRNKIGYLLLSNLVFFLGVLSKENAIMFVLIIPLSLYFFTKVPMRKNLAIAASFLFTALIFVFIRFLVLGYLNSGELPRELLNNPFLDATQSEKYGTILYTLGLYVKLLFFPHPLTHDYYPYHIPLIPITDWRAILSLLVHVALLAYVIMKFKSKDLIAFGILFYLLTLFIVSNLVFSVGTFMNERFIYMPSLGFALILATLFTRKLPLIISAQMYKKYAAWILVAVLVLLSVRTYTRNTVWKDNFTLFTSDVQISENSIKCNVSAGGDYQKKAGEETDPVKKDEYYQLSIKHLEKAISIYPKTSNGLLLYGNALTLYRKDYKQAITQYLRILEFDPYNRNAATNTMKVLGSLDNASESAYKRSILKQLYALNTENAEVNYALGKLYGQFLGNLDSASYFLNRSLTLNPGDIAIYKDLGIVYSMQGDYDKAIDIFSRGARIDPGDQQIRQNILITEQIMAQKKNQPNRR